MAYKKGKDRRERVIFPDCIGKRLHDDVLRRPN